MKRIYLSGPMTGPPGLNFPAFHTITTQLRAAGHAVTNPAELNPDCDSWNDSIHRGIGALITCDTAVMIPD